MEILVTGAGGMLGHYIYQKLKSRIAHATGGEANSDSCESEAGSDLYEGDAKSGSCRITTLGLRPESDIRCDLSNGVPNLGERKIDFVYHCAGSTEETDAIAVNLDGTKNLCKSLTDNPPRHFVYISSHEVYSPDAGENINEDAPTWALGKVGQSKALAESFLKEWCEKNDVKLTILRPARMFGEGVHGETVALFNEALSGKYIHIRGNNAKTSIVTAYDVAEAAIRLSDKGGVYNVSDGRPIRFLDMMETMTANAGARKRMTHLPGKWADFFWRYMRFLPIVSSQLNPETLSRRSKTQTLDNSRCREAAGMEFFDTAAVIARTEPDYPYESSRQDDKDRKEGAHEV